MNQPLIKSKDPPLAEQLKIHEKITFHECLGIVEGRGMYQKKIFIMLGFFWIFASFFIALQYYLYKKPQYIGCQLIEGDQQCIGKICEKSAFISFIKPENTLTFYFQLFCEKQWMRVALKIFPECLSAFGFLLYGRIADVKGRKTAMIISWRMYTFGVIVYSVTQTMFLRVLGYAIACFHCFPALVFTFILVFEQNTQKTRNRIVLLLWASLFVGPLVLSFVSEPFFTMNQTTNAPNITIRLLLLFICAIPAFIGSIMGNYICQSAIFAYPTNKIHAFNIINHISSKNKRLPILIDLSRSSWKKYKPSIHLSLVEIMKEYPWNMKLILGFCMMFMIYYNIKLSQTSLDPYTDSYLRSILINSSTAFADLTLCFLISRIKNRSCRPLLIASLILLVGRMIMMIIEQKNENWQESSLYKYFMIVIVLLLRYISEFTYGITLIWTIQSFPTVFRAQAVGIIMVGSSIACTLVYLIRYDMIVTTSISVGLVAIGIYFQSLLQFNIKPDQKLPDTLKGQKFDQNDCFYKFL